MNTQTSENPVPTVRKLNKVSGAKGEFYKGMAIMVSACVFTCLGIVKFNEFISLYISTVLASNATTFDPNAVSDLITVVMLCFSALGVSVFYFGVSRVNLGLRLYREITRENALGHSTAEKR